MSKRKLKKISLPELGKNLLIIVLVASALFLARESGYGSVLIRRIESGELSGDSGDALSAGSESGESARGAVPAGISLSFGNGQRGGWIYDEEAVSEVFLRFSAALGEALGSSGEPERISETTFRSGLDARGVYLQLGCAQPLGLLSARLGAEMKSAADAMADLVFLCAESGSVALYFRDGEGGFFRCGTGLNPEALEAGLAELQPNGACFAYEQAGLEGLEPYTLICDALPKMAAAEGSGVALGESGTEKVFLALGINGYVASRYTESSGTRVFIDGDNTLRISPSGSIEFSGEGADGLDSPQKAAEAALEIAESILLPYCGAAHIGMSSMSGSDGNYSIRFDYLIGGVPVSLKTGHAAVVTVKNGTVTKVEIILRAYTLGDGTEEVLPLPQAAAIVSAGSSSRLLLRYRDSGESVDCKWVSD